MNLVQLLTPGYSVWYYCCYYNRWCNNRPDNQYICYWSSQCEVINILDLLSENYCILLIESLTDFQTLLLYCSLFFTVLNDKLLICFA
ncbi:hypothetical protein FKM82_009514 [Ascaphus truei]